MERVSAKNYRKIGFIRKIHGVRGEVVMEFEHSAEELVVDTSLFFIELDGLPVPFFVAEKGLRITSSKTASISFDWVETEKYARRLVGNSVYLLSDEIVEKPDENTTNQLINYQIFDGKNVHIGFISGIDNFSGNVVLRVISGVKEILLPYNPDLIIAVDHEKQFIKINIPEGLI
jgi:16S rRNA processing protein RimM